jgi:hypothetical protein
VIKRVWLNSTRRGDMDFKKIKRPTINEMMAKPVTEWTVAEKLFISQELSKAFQEIDRLRLMVKQYEDYK